MPEDDAGAAADPALVAVTEVGEKAAGAVAVESKQEFAPELLAWLKRFKLESPDMLETLKKLNAYKVSGGLRFGSGSSQSGHTRHCCTHPWRLWVAFSAPWRLSRGTRCRTARYHR